MKKGVTYAERAKQLGISDWESLPEKFKRAYIADILENWPKMDREDRIIVSTFRPGLVKAAGLELVLEGPEDIERYEKYGYPKHPGL